MGWIQFIQIAKEAGWHDSSLYLIQGLVSSVTSYLAKLWFLHLIIIMNWWKDSGVEHVYLLYSVSIDFFTAHPLCPENGNCFFFCCVDAAITLVALPLQLISIRCGVTVLTSKSLSCCVTAFIPEWKWASVYVYVCRGGEASFTVTEKNFD